MPTIKIEGDGHTVEIHSDDALDYVATKAQDVWNNTKSSTSKLGMGFGSQSTERGGSSNVKGDPVFQYGGPVDA